MISEKSHVLLLPSRKIGTIYNVKEAKCMFLSNHLIPSTLVTEEVQARQQYGTHSISIDKNGWEMDTLSLQVYSAVALNFRSANHHDSRAIYELFL